MGHAKYGGSSSGYPQPQSSFQWRSAWRCRPTSGSIGRRTLEEVEDVEAPELGSDGLRGGRDQVAHLVQRLGPPLVAPRPERRANPRMDSTFPSLVLASPAASIRLDVHMAAALDERGALLGSRASPPPRAATELLGWLAGFGSVEPHRRRGSGSGAGLTRHLQAERIRVVEVDRPTANTVGARASPTPKTPSPPPGPLSQAMPAVTPRRGTETSNPCGGLRVARASARKGRTQALNQMRNLVSTAPEPIRAELRGLNVFHLLERAAAYRPGCRATSPRKNATGMRIGVGGSRRNCRHTLHAPWRRSPTGPALGAPSTGPQPGAE